MIPDRPDGATARPSDAAIVAGSLHPHLAAEVAAELGLALARCTTERFPDGEMHVEVEPNDVEGRDVFVVQPTASPSEGRASRGADASLELLLVADACRRAGAASLSAVVPYFGYARQDRRKKAGEPLGVHVVAKLLATAGFERYVVVDPHSHVVEATLDAPTETLTAVPLLAEALGEMERGAVVVAPDFGAVHRARHYAKRLRAPLAIVQKVRASGTEVAVESVTGDVRGRRPILVDDMIATGGTIVAAARALVAEGARDEVVVAATHGVFAPDALERLHEAGVRRVLVTDTLPRAAHRRGVTVVPVAPLLAAYMRRTLGRRAAERV